MGVTVLREEEIERRCERKGVRVGGREREEGEDRRDGKKKKNFI